MKFHVNRTPNNSTGIPIIDVVEASHVYVDPPGSLIFNDSKVEGPYYFGIVKAYAPGKWNYVEWDSF